MTDYSGRHFDSDSLPDWARDERDEADALQSLDDTVHIDVVRQAEPVPETQRSAAGAPPAPGYAAAHAPRTEQGPKSSWPLVAALAVGIAVAAAAWQNSPRISLANLFPAQAQQEAARPLSKDEPAGSDGASSETEAADPEEPSIPAAEDAIPELEGAVPEQDGGEAYGWELPQDQDGYDAPDGGYGIPWDGYGWNFGDGYGFALPEDGGRFHFEQDGEGGYGHSFPDGSGREHRFEFSFPDEPGEGWGFGYSWPDEQGEPRGFSYSQEDGGFELRLDGSGPQA